MKSVFCKFSIYGFFIIILITALSGCSLINGQNKRTTAISMNTSNERTSSSKTDYVFKENEIVTFSIKSTVKSGDLSLKLVDSEGTVINEFTTNKKEEKEIKIYKTDTYDIVVICDKFVGSYEIKWK